MIGELPDIRAHQFIFLISKYPAHGIIEEGEVPGSINLIIALHDALEDRSIFHFTLLRHFLYPLAINDVGLFLRFGLLQFFVGRFFGHYKILPLTLKIRALMRTKKLALKRP